MSDRWLTPWLQRGYDLEAARKIRDGIVAYRRLLAAGAHGKGRGTACETRNRTRFARDRASALRRRLLQNVPIRWTKDLVVQHVVTQEPILDGLFPERVTKWKPIFERAPKADELTLSNFSFVDDPVATIRNLQTIARFETDLTEGRLNFSDSLCLDIGSFLVLQEMVRGMLPLIVGGRITTPIQRVLDMVGLQRALRMHFPNDFSRTAISPLPFRSRRPQGASPDRLLRPQTSEHVATEVIVKINEWLEETLNCELTEDGERLVLSMTGEALDNAERHSTPQSTDGSWSIAGFMARRRYGGQGGDVYHRCHLALLSTGATIAETIRTAGQATRARMNAYVSRHQSLFNHRFTRENLETVFALQDGVTRFDRSVGTPRGGTGLMDILQFFGALSGTDNPTRTRPTLSIVSGSTCILVRPPYMVSAEASAGVPPGTKRAPRQLWFNPANSDTEPPDGAHVLALPGRLSGTLISMAWTIDKDFMLRREDAEARS